MSDDLPPYTIDVNKKPGPNWSHSVAVEVIDRLRAMEDGWDLSGPKPNGKAPTEEAINCARFMAIVPTFEGGLQFEWHANGWDVELEVNAAGEVDNIFWRKKD